MLIVFFLVLGSSLALQCNQSHPNFVIILMDDMGYADLGAYGHPARETPNLDRMAREGLLFTDFYSPSPLCSPSRAALLTGRLPIRNGLYTTNLKARNSYVPQDMLGGISSNEILLPRLLHQAGYHSKIVGKWHLGHANARFYPLANGFDQFFGSPNVHFGPYDDKEMPNVPVFQDDHMLGRYYEKEFFIDDVRHVSNLTTRFTDEALTYIDARADDGRPFLLYWTPDTLHAPTYRSKAFVGRSSKDSSYGDALMEIDHSVGLILASISSHACLANNTLVFFTSDNGAALVSKEDAGNTGQLLCGKQTTFEGGLRVPGVAWWPGKIAPDRTTNQVASSMDLFRTFARLANVSLPSDRVYDSNDLGDILFGDQKNEKAAMFYYRGDTLMAVRLGAFKAHFWTFTEPWEEYEHNIDYCPGSFTAGITTHNLTDHRVQPLLYHVVRDAGERFPISHVSQEYVSAMERIRRVYDEHMGEMVPGQPVLNWCDAAAMHWAPPGCDKIDMCLPVPPSKPYRCVWPH